MPLKLVRRRGQPNWYMRGAVAGRPVYRSTGTDCKEKAEAIKAKAEGKIWDSHIFGERAVVTFEAAALSYMEMRDPRPSDEVFIDKLLIHFRGKKLFEINQASVDGACQAILRPGAANSTKLRNVITPLTAILNHAARRGWCEKPSFERPEQPRGRVRWVYPEDADRLVENAARHLKPLIVFLFHSGARLSEALELEWEDVHLGHGFVTFQDTKNGEARSVPINGRCVAALANLPFRQGPVFLRPGGLYKDRERARGGQIRTGFGGACERAGIENFTPHDCRHTWATWVYNQTKDLLLLQQYGGWKSLAMVQRYAHVIPAHVDLGVKVIPNRAESAHGGARRADNPLKAKEN
jgi:integrase